MPRCQSKLDQPVLATLGGIASAHDRMRNREFCQQLFNFNLCLTVVCIEDHAETQAGRC